MSYSTTSKSSEDSSSSLEESESASSRSSVEAHLLLVQVDADILASAHNLLATFPNLNLITFRDQHVVVIVTRRLAHEVARPPQIAQQNLSNTPRKEP